jgi:predicted phage gp36 major capsid-like protein
MTIIRIRTAANMRSTATPMTAKTKTGNPPLSAGGLTEVAVEERERRESSSKEGSTATSKIPDYQMNKKLIYNFLSCSIVY